MRISRGCRPGRGAYDDRRTTPKIGIGCRNSSQDLGVTKDAPAKITATTGLTALERPKHTPYPDGTELQRVSILVRQRTSFRCKKNCGLGTGTPSAHLITCGDLPRPLRSQHYTVAIASTLPTPPVPPPGVGPMGYPHPEGILQAPLRWCLAIQTAHRGLQHP